MICHVLIPEQPGMQRMCTIKRDFGPEKYTFARFKCSRFDQTRRRKAGVGYLSRHLSGLRHETFY